jgi:exonuclease SbcC
VIRRITLENFMSHKHTVLDLADGLTVLVGPNNCGKSAVVSALEALCTNPPSSYAIRHGEGAARVTVETDDGHTITWERKKGNAAYLINGRPVHRLGQGKPPDDLHEKLRLPLVALDDRADTVNIHFGEQKSPIFEVLSDRAKAASFFASSSDASRLLEMQRLHRDRVRQSTIRRNTLEMEQRRLAQEEAILAPSEDLQQRAAAIAKEHEGILKARAEAEAMAVTTAQFLAFEAQITHHRREVRALQKTQEPPVLADTARLHEACWRIAKGLEFLRHESEKRRALDPLKQPPECLKTETLATLCSDLKQVQSRKKYFAGQQSAVRALQEPPELADVEPLRGLLAKLQNAKAETEQRQREARSLAKLSPAPERLSPAELDQLLSQFARLAKEKQDHQSELARIDSEMKAVRDEMRKWTEANPTCPLCGGIVDPEKALHAGGHSHD